MDYSQFKLFLQQKGDKPSTIYRLSNLYKRLLRDVGFPLTQDKVTLFVSSLKEKGLKATYINDYLDFCRLWNECFNLPQFTIKYFKEEEFIKSTMSDSEIEAFLNLPCKTFTLRHRTGKMFVRRTDPHHHAIFNMFWSLCAFSGARMGEIAKLKINDVDFGSNRILLSDTKTNDFRYIPIAPNIKEDLDRHIKQLKGLYLFPSRRGGLQGNGFMDSTDWGYDFHDRIKRLEIKRDNLSPYSLRHSFCTRLLETDTPFPIVMKAMGHKRAETTMQYTHLSVKDVERAITKLPLVRKSTDPRMVLLALVEFFSSLFEKDNRFEKQITDNGDEILIRVKIKKNPNSPSMG